MLSDQRCDVGPTGFGLRHHEVLCQLEQTVNAVIIGRAGEVEESFGRVRVSYLAGRPVKVLPACGVCQERLQAFGLEVLVAVSADPAIYKTLAELRPWPWWEERPTDGDTTWSARRR